MRQGNHPPASSDIDVVLMDPATSYWLHYAILQLASRDPIDALRDVEVLFGLASARAEAALADAQGRVS